MMVTRKPKVSMGASIRTHGTQLTSLDISCEIHKPSNHLMHLVASVVHLSGLFLLQTSCSFPHNNPDPMYYYLLHIILAIDTQPWDTQSSNHIAAFYRLASSQSMGFISRRPFSWTDALSSCLRHHFHKCRTCSALFFPLYSPMRAMSGTYALPFG